MTKPRSRKSQSTKVAKASSPKRPQASAHEEKRRSSLQYLIGVFALVAIAAMILRSMLPRPATTQELNEPIASDVQSSSLESKTADELASLLQLPEIKLKPAASAKDIDDWTSILDQKLNQLQMDYPKDAQAIHLHGLVQSRLKRTKLAEPSLQRCVTLAPQDLQMRIDLADHLSGLGRDDEAIIVLQGSPKDAVLTTDYFNALGNCQLQLGELDVAEKSFATSLERNPNQPDTWIKLGKVQQQQKKVEESEHSARKAIECNRENSEAWSLLSRSQALAGKHEESKLSAEQSQKLSQSRWQVSQRDLEEEHSAALTKLLCSSFRSAAILHQNKGNYQRAMELMELSNRVDPTDALTLIGWSALLRRAGSLEQAIEIQRQLVKLQPLESAHYQNLANIFMTTDRPLEAEAILRLCSLNQPNNGQSQLLLAKFLLLLNKHGQAVAPAESAFEILKSSESLEVMQMAKSGVR